ncbi:MAG: sugar transferase, partial [Ruminiclostridium sp.]
MKDIEYNAYYIVGQRAMFENVSLLYLFGKRLFDFTAALTAIILLSPIFLLIVIFIKLDSPGPVFFNQKRNGFKGKSFNMHKFRSMVLDAENRFNEVEDKNEVSGYMFKIKNDPRITKVGKIIRKTSVDELPQLFNVL